MELAAETAAASSPATGTGVEITFPQGLPGFPLARRFLLSPLSGAPGFFELRSLEDPTLALVLAGTPGELPAICPEDLEAACGAAGIEPGRAAVFFVVTLVREGARSRAYVNLRAPVLVDAEARTAAQVVLADPGYPLRFPLPRRAA